MVSTRQMSTTVASNNGTDENCTRLSVITRQSSALSTITSNTKTNHSIGHNSSTCKNLDVLSEATSQLKLVDLPIEILDKIFAYVGYKKVGQMRLISTDMNDICSAILNSTFSKLQTQILYRFQTVKAKMPRRESARRNHPLACECDIIETCYMRLSLLQMTFGKHIERNLCCFFPGGILDEVYNIINYIRTTPKLERPYKVTDELFDLSTMAMEYFKEHIETVLPKIGYFDKDYFNLTSKCKPTYSLKPISELSNSSSSMPSPPQSNMVLRKGIRKIKQGMKMYNNQLTVLRSELRNCKRKSSEQGKQIAEQQKLIAEQQKQTLEYANRLDENDKKNEEISKKFSTLLQELNKCKTELQYWRSKSPATQVCTTCGHKMPPVTPEDFQALVNQGVKPEDINISVDDVDSSDTGSTTADNSGLDFQANPEFILPLPPCSSSLKKIRNNSEPVIANKRRLDGEIIPFDTRSILNNIDLDIDTQMFMPSLSKKREYNNSGEGNSSNNVPSTSSTCNSSPESASQNIISSDTKKARRVQNKGSRCYSVSNKRSKGKPMKLKK